LKDKNTEEREQEQDQQDEQAEQERIERDWNLPTQWSCQEFITTAGPNDRAGFMPPPDKGI